MITESEWLIIRQHQYNILMAKSNLFSPESQEMFENHKLVVKKIDKLPYSQGGRTT